MNKIIEPSFGNYISEHKTYILVGLIIVVLTFTYTIWNHYQNWHDKVQNDNKNIIDVNQAKDERKNISSKIDKESEKIVSKQDSIIKEVKKSSDDISKQIKNKKTNPSVNVKDSPNTIIQISESGDNIVKEHIPDPKIIFEPISTNKVNNQFISKIYLTIDYKFNINNLFLKAISPTIKKLEIIPQRSGMLILGHSGERDGYAFTNIPNAYGKYMLIITTEKYEKTTIEYDF